MLNEHQANFILTNELVNYVNKSEEELTKIVEEKILFFKKYYDDYFLKHGMEKTKLELNGNIYSNHYIKAFTVGYEYYSIKTPDIKSKLISQSENCQDLYSYSEKEITPFFHKACIIGFKTFTNFINNSLST